VMAGEKDDGLIGLARGDGDTGIGQTADPGSDARDDTERNALGGQRRSLLGAAAEHHGIAALEAQYALAGPRQGNQLEGDVGLLFRGLATALAGIDALGLGATESQQLRADKRVVDDDVGLAEGEITEQRQ